MKTTPSVEDILKEKDAEIEQLKRILVVHVKEIERLREELDKKDKWIKTLKHFYKEG